MGALSKEERSEIVRRGRELFRNHIRPTLSPSDDGKYVAIDVDSGEYELDDDDVAAGLKLKARQPNANMFLERAGFETAYRFSYAGPGTTT